MTGESLARSKADRLLNESRRRGAKMVYVVQNATDDAAGVVTKDPVTHTVYGFGPLDDSTSDKMAGANASFVLPSVNFSPIPKRGDRIRFKDRVWQVKTVVRAAHAGVTIAWDLACSEVVE